MKKRRMDGGEERRGVREGGSEGGGEGGAHQRWRQLCRMQSPPCVSVRGRARARGCPPALADAPCGGKRCSQCRSSSPGRHGYGPGPGGRRGRRRWGISTSIPAQYFLYSSIGTGQHTGPTERALRPIPSSRTWLSFTTPLLPPPPLLSHSTPFQHSNTPSDPTASTPQLD